MPTAERSFRSGSLRLSLLTSLGLGTLACGGNSEPLPTYSDPLGAGGHTGTAACTDPAPVDQYTGLVRCSEGYSHRPATVHCGAPSEGGAPSAAVALPYLGSQHVACSEQEPASCSEFHYGYCDVVAATCRSGCITDNDCDQGLACVCRGGAASPNGGVCVATGCRVDAECPGNSICSPSASEVGQNQGQGGGCVALAPANAFECAKPYDGHSGTGTGGAFTAVACGRPFLVASTPRVATVIASADWAELGGPRPRVDHLTFSEREALAMHWAGMGQMEHASIAAFARFSLQLLALGAPPALVDACTRALADETAHTRLCFQFASVYAGRSLGPGPLDVARSLELSAITDVVDLVVAEGCFGETSAALDALEAAASATDPVLQQAYSRIARDEQRHAELAFRFVRWALERGGEPVRRRVAAAVVSPPTHHHAAGEVTLPCLTALLRLSAPAEDPRASADAKDMTERLG